MRGNIRQLGWAVMMSLTVVSVADAAAPASAPPVSYGVEDDTFHPVRAQNGMVASVDALATQVGVDILRQGGNAVDAAVAVGFALAVTHPRRATWAAAALCCCVPHPAALPLSTSAKWRRAAPRAICSSTNRVTPTASCR